MNTKNFVHVCVFYLANLGFIVFSERNKRELKLPKGASLSVAVALVTRFPSGPLYEGIVQLLQFEMKYPLPDNVVFGSNEENKEMVPEAENWLKTENNIFQRKKWVKRRRTKRNLNKEKLELLRNFEDVITKMGYDGFACVSRFQCELNYISPKNSLIEEILVSLFSLPFFEKGKECEEFVKNCPFSLLHILLHSQQSFNFEE